MSDSLDNALGGNRLVAGTKTAADFFLVFVGILLVGMTTDILLTDEPVLLGTYLMVGGLKMVALTGLFDWTTEVGLLVVGANISSSRFPPRRLKPRSTSSSSSSSSSSAAVAVPSLLAGGTPFPPSVVDWNVVISFNILIIDDSIKFGVFYCSILFPQIKPRTKF